MRSICLPALAGALALALFPSPAAAQIGVGGRFAMVRDDAHVDSDSVRFNGGHVRVGMTKRAAIELSMDFKTTEPPGEGVRTKDRPLQASLLLYPMKSTLAPYLLGGIGWYKREVQLMDGDAVVSSTSATEFGYHGGFGLQIGLGKHAAVHGDYRYTGLHFGDDNEDGGSSLIPSLSNLLPGYTGSMWTVGFTVYF